MAFGRALRLPDRYFDVWREPFHERLRAVLAPGAVVLDAGSGRSPAVPTDLRPANCYYVGLDVSAEELALAPSDAYDDVVVADLLALDPTLYETFDVVVSWQVLEHVRSLPVALDTIQRYLKPGGYLVAQLSGRWAAFAVLNRMVPHSLGARIMRRFLKREPDTVFRAYYDHATMSGIAGALDAWRDVEIIPRYRGGTYFAPLPIAQRLYFADEEWAQERHANLATHYLVVAKK